MQIEAKKKEVKKTEALLTNAKYKESVVTEDIRKEKEAVAIYVKSTNEETSKHSAESSKSKGQFDSYFALSRYDNFFMQDIWSIVEKE